MCYFGRYSGLWKEHVGTILRDGLWKLNPMRLELQVDMGGVDLDTGFPKALALLRHMEITETGRREFCPEGIMPHTSGTSSIPGEHPYQWTPSAVLPEATSLTLLCKWTFWVQE